jgi:hypothetical protein
VIAEVVESRAVIRDGAVRHRLIMRSLGRELRTPSPAPAPFTGRSR